MAVIAGYKWDDPNYLAFLEDEYICREKEDERKQKIKAEGEQAEGDAVITADQISGLFKSLDCITSRLDKIESGHKSGDPSTSPADLLTAPLTKALAHLVIDEDDSGRQLRPETYCQADIKDKLRD